MNNTQNKAKKVAIQFMIDNARNKRTRRTR